MRRCLSPRAAQAAVFALLFPTVAVAADPPFYVRKDTWQATMLASREALMAGDQERLPKSREPLSKDAGSFRPAGTGEVGKRGSGRRLRVRVRGLEYLWLIHTTTAEDRDKLAGCWGEGKLITREGEVTPLSKLEPIRTSGPLPTAFNAGADPGEESKSDKGGRQRRRRRPPRIGRKLLTYGLVVQPDGALCYRLDGKYEIFEATVGLLSAKDRKVTMQFRASHLPLRETLRRENDRVVLWRLIERDFSSLRAVREIGRERQGRIWDGDWQAGSFRDLAMRYARLVRTRPAAARTKALAVKAKTAADVLEIARISHRWQDAAENLARAKSVNLRALRLAVEDLIRTFGGKYPRGAEYLQRLAAAEKLDLSLAAEAGAVDPERIGRLAGRLLSLQREALLDNPLLDFDKLLVVKRSLSSPRLGLPQNWQGNCALPKSGYDNEIAILSPVRPKGTLTTLYRPKRDVFVGDVDLHFDGERLLFSSLAETGRWQVFEIRTDGTGLRQVTRGRLSEVDNYDPCYLPNERIVFASSAVMTGVPCVGGKTPVSNLFVMDPDGGNARQLCFDQDHDWCPTVLPNGRVMYTRWEYTDAPHYFTRLLFHMNPDGTQQMELYGSNSYWPNAIYYARPVPNHPTKIIAVISGHHGVARMGELVLFDPARGRQEASGALQRIPGHGKQVEAIIRDGLVNNSWPKFLNPYPLSDKYFLVSCRKGKSAPWALCLVDVFDNIVPICELPGTMIIEPIPLRKTPRPPVVPERVDLARKDAVVYMTDVYSGAGLRGVPRGAVKKMRVFEWHYAYQRVGGHRAVAVEGGWDVKRILGTVPVREDGSALFRVPANTPLAVQPLDEAGRALQLMRSWFVAMPGEILSCVGCHERQTTGSSNRRTLAARGVPREIQPWRGPARGFGFKREVQPVLDKHCVACHNGKERADGKAIPNFADAQRGRNAFTNSYIALHPYVRRPGPESDYHMLPPAEYHANTSELIQMLRKGHHNVRPDAEAWDRLHTWIDLNVPDHGTWTEQAGEARTAEQRKLRAELRKLYANIDDDPEAIPTVARPPIQPIRPKPLRVPPAADITCPGWPFDAPEAKRRQAAAGPRTTYTIDLGDGVKMQLVLVPAGEFVMGNAGGALDERPRTRVRIDRPFWIGRTEVTNRQYRRFDATHDSRFVDQHWKDHNTPGYPANGPEQPVIRISWRQAMAFCRWLSRRTGRRFTLPAEAQWEYACRAGSATPLSYGDLDADFSKFANMADLSMRRLAVRGVRPRPLRNLNPVDDFLPKDARFDDGRMIVSDVGKYQPNAWGLLDMHGNVAEWTLSAYGPYPYRGGDGRNDPVPTGEKVVRGGSWRDRPKRCRSAFRLSYPSWQAVFNVGFRVVCDADRKTPLAAKADR